MLACNVPVREKNAGSVAVLSRIILIIFRYMSASFRRAAASVPQICHICAVMVPHVRRLVPLMRRREGAGVRRTIAGFRRRAAELPAVSQERSQAGTKVRVFLLMNPAKGLIGKSCHRKVDMRAKLPPLTLTLFPRWGERG